MDEITTTILDRARAYAEFGLRVFPVHATDKTPMPKYFWAEMASSRVNHVVEDFTYAAELWHEDHVSIAWALGQDGFMAVDIDVDSEHWPPWMAELVEAAAINPTRRGQHLIFPFPEGLEPGNSTTGFPSQGWGEVRGLGGYIIIDGPDRPGLNVEALAEAKPFPHPDWLTPYSGGANAVSLDEVVAFANEHDTGTMPNKMNGLKAILEAWMPGVSRHNTAQKVLVLAAEESARGFYPFKNAVPGVRGWWDKVMVGESPRRNTVKEFENMVQWAVGRALEQNPPTVDEDVAPVLAVLDGTGPDLGDLAHFVDFDKLWDASDEMEWLVERFWERDRSVLLFAKWATGKSELALYVAASLALGVDPFSQAAIEPVRVLYLDYEMNEADLRRQLLNFGYGPENDFSLLHYAIYPALPALNSPSGGEALGYLLDMIKPECVIVDTYSASTVGNENDPETTANFNRFVLQVCHRRQVALMYLDHPGKDEKLGALGSTRKNTQVDVIWEMARADQERSVRLTNRKNRQGSMPKSRMLTRIDDEYVRFRAPAAIDEMVMTPAVVDKAKQLDEAGVPETATRAEAIEGLKAAGHRPGKTAVLVDAMHYRADRHQRGLTGHRPQPPLRLVDNGDDDD